ncbi:MAG: translocation/assembly module TamB domain-containing protein [Cuspidothrix sp.]
MSNSSSHENFPTPNSGLKHLWLMIFSRGGLAVAAFVLLGIVGGIWRLRNFVYEEIVPLATESLTTTLNRPVKLGAVKSFSATGVEFAASEIPATPTDPDRASIKAVNVGYDIWKLIIDRHLQLDVTLVNPDIYLEQDNQGRWLTTTIAPATGKGLIKTDLDKLRFSNGNLVLVPKVREGDKNPVPISVGFAQVNGTAQILPNNKVIKLDLLGKPATGGGIAIAGDLIPEKTLAGDFNIKADNLSAADITRIVSLPLNLEAGKVNGNVRIQVTPYQKPLLYGDVTVEGVTLSIPRLPQLLLNSQGKLSFDGLAIKLDQIVTNYGQIPLTATGLISQETGFNLKGRVNAVSLANAQNTLNVKLPVPVKGIAQADLQISGKINEPVLSGNVSTLKTAQIDQVDFSKVSSKFELISSKSLLNITDIYGKTTLGGEVKGAGVIKLGKVPALNFQLRGENLPGDAIAQLYKIKTGFPIGQMTATAELTGVANNTQTVVKWQAPQAKYPVNGTAIINPDRTVSFRDIAANFGGGVVKVNGTYSNGNWQAIAAAERIKLTSLIEPKAQQNISLAGSEFNGNLRLLGSTSPFKLETIVPENANVNIAGGTVNISQIKFADKNITALLVAENLRLATILKRPNPILNYPLAGNFMITSNQDNFNLKTFSGLGEALLAVDGGTIKATNIQVADGRYQAKIAADNLPLAKLASVPPQLSGFVDGQLQVTGSVESFQPETIQGLGSGRLKLPSGTIAASYVQLNQGRYQGLLTTSNLQLRPFNQQLQGKLGGKLQVAGTLAATKLADVAAVGELRFSRGLAGINSLIQADVGWNGEKLTINSSNNANLQANSSTALTIKGYILANAKKVGIPELTAINLNVDAKNYNLQQLPIKLPNIVDIAGKLDFQGQLTGKPTAPNIIGKLGLRHLKVEQFAFEPLLTGKVNAISGQGVSLDVIGKSDRIAVNLDGQNRPQSFRVQWQAALLSGMVKGVNWVVNISNVPLQALNIPLPKNPLLSPGRIAGLLNIKELNINTKTLATSGNIEIKKPEIGRIKGDQFSTTFDYNQDTVTLKSSEFNKGDSKYNFDVTVKRATKKPQLEANIKIEKGKIEDILATAQLFDFPDFQRGLKSATYGTAKDLTNNSQGLPTESLLSQIQRLSEIDALKTNQEEQQLDAKPLPELRDLKGIFQGDITINTATSNEPKVKFNLAGENFKWGQTDKDGKAIEPKRFYAAETVTAIGGFEDGILRLQPLKIKSQEKLIEFTGNIGGKQQSGKLEIANFPLDRLNDIAKLPVRITGKVNANAALAGTLKNPQATGELNITEGTINQKRVEAAKGSFSYANGRLNFGSTVLGIGGGGEPANIDGSIPYSFSSSTRISDNDKINLNVKVKNEGLGLLNLFTNEIAFENGKGELDLKVQGTRQKPLVEGFASLADATFSAQALPGKLTNVTGSAKFDFTRVFVESLEGKFSDGKVEAVGELPIYNSNIPIDLDKRLNVNLEQLSLNLKALYQGGANGNLEITGSVLEPKIGGNIELFNGQVFLAESTNGSASSSKVSNFNPKNQEKKSPTLKELELKLGKNVEIARPPVLKFQATGDLIVNGSIARPIPEGTIKLTKGGVNLFTTQLNLARGYEHTATFSSLQPRDPQLDIRLFAKILDIVQNSDILNRQGSTGLAGLETVRVEATINGLASQLNDNLQLTSIPSRSQTQIVTLLGGGFVDTQGRGDSTLGLINIAGSAVFNNFQGAFNQIADSFGLSELRIFPTILSEKPESGRNNSSLELALEAGVDISRKVSISTIKILTADDPLQWGINYRINNQFRIRSSTNLTDDSRAVIEFETRF